MVSDTKTHMQSPIQYTNPDKKLSVREIFGIDTDKYFEDAKIIDEVRD